jgi:hypothetical protein
MGVTQEIAQFTAKTTFNQLPPEVGVRFKIPGRMKRGDGCC